MTSLVFLSLLLFEGANGFTKNSRGPNRAQLRNSIRLCPPLRDLSALENEAMIPVAGTTVAGNPGQAAIFEQVDTVDSVYFAKTGRVNLSPRYVGDLLHTVSRPKKKNVSWHSIVSTLWVGVFVSAWSSLFAPMRRNVDGFPQLFDFCSNLSPSTVFQLRLSSMLASLVAIMGLFRIPHNAPRCRKLAFRSMAAGVVSFWALQDSNFAGQATNFTVDVFTWWGKAILVASQAYFLLIQLQTLDDAIVGSNRQRDTIPLMESRFLSFLTTSIFYTLMALTMRPTMAVLPGRAAFDAVGPDMYELGFRNAVISGFSAFVGAMSFCAFFATMRFERKIGKWAARFADISLITILVVQPFLSIFSILHRVDRSAINAFVDYLAVLFKRYRPVELLLTAYIGTLLNSLRRRRKLSKASTSSSSSAVP